MPNPDIIFMHPPTTLDFRQRKVLYGPISDVIPSTPIFEMYPIGFAILSEHLHRHGFASRIVNLAMKMLHKSEFQVEQFIQKVKAPLFGIDLHWLPHIQGALETAKLVKKHHPDSKVVFGGLSSTYFHEDLIKYENIDYVLRGDSTEEPLRLLMEKVVKQPSESWENDLSAIPNLTWKNAKGDVHVNQFTYRPENLDYINIDYGRLFRTAVTYKDWSGYVPYHNWMYYPVLGVLTCRGCAHNCAACGGSAYSTKLNCHRGTPIFRSNKKLIEDIRKARGIVKAPLFIFGDINQMGDENAMEFFDMLSKVDSDNEIIIEFFKPPSRELLKAAVKAAPRTSIEISPETHDQDARIALGKPYNNAELERSIADAVELGCKRVDVFFMTGLSRQTVASVRETCRYAEYLLKRFGAKKQIFPYISPLAPFVDPGSRAHEYPDQFGYRLLANKLEGYRRHMQAPSWKHMLNYETKWMNRDQISDATYESSLEFNRLKVKYGLLDEKLAQQIGSRISQEQKQMEEIDRWCLNHEHPQPESSAHHENGYCDNGLKWDRILFTKSTCASDELDRTLWLFGVIPFPKFLRQFILWFWKRMMVCFD